MSLPSFSIHPSPFPLSPSPSPLAGFTLVELLVTVTSSDHGGHVVAPAMARRCAAEEKTKATIAKLDAIVMRATSRTARGRCRLPSRRDAAIVWQRRYSYLCDARFDADGNAGAATRFLCGGRPAIGRPRPTWAQKYAQKYNQAAVKFTDNGTAKCLYLWISMSDPTVMEQFTATKSAIPTTTVGRCSSTAGASRSIFCVRQRALVPAKDWIRPIRTIPNIRLTSTWPPGHSVGQSEDRSQPVGQPPDHAFPFPADSARVFGGAPIRSTALRLITNLDYFYELKVPLNDTSTISIRTFRSQWLPPRNSACRSKVVDRLSRGRGRFARFCR